MTTSLSPSSLENNILSNGLRVQIATFNCNLQGLSTDIPDLTSWLIPSLTSASPTREPVDIYAIGFQELLPLDVGFSNAASGLAAINRTDTEIRRTLRPHSAITQGKDGKYPQNGGVENYTLLGKSHMVGLTVFVYGRERTNESDLANFGEKRGKENSLVNRVKEVRVGNVGTGLLGLMGNKGAVGVRIVLKSKDLIGNSSSSSDEKNGTTTSSSQDEVLTFVCAHLAAHDHNVPRRNQDWKNIVQRLVFDKDSVKALPAIQVNPLHQGSQGNSGPADLKDLTEKYEKEGNPKKSQNNIATKALDSNSYSIYDTTHLFIFGDLNYRIAFNTLPTSTLLRKGLNLEKLKKTDIKRKINQRDYKTLVAYDQLNIERLSEPSRVFQGLNEFNLAEAGFGPTYKFKVVREGKEFDKDGKKINPAELSKKRVPGWTDRILFNGEIGEGIGDVKVELYTSIMKYTVSVLYLFHCSCSSKIQKHARQDRVGWIGREAKIEITSSLDPLL